MSFYKRLHDLAFMGDMEYYCDGSNDDVLNAFEPLTEWKTEPPVKDGWYWFRLKGWNQPFCAWVWFDDEILCVGQLGTLYNVSNITHWLGPVPPPLPPGE